MIYVTQTPHAAAFARRLVEKGIAVEYKDPDRFDDSCCTYDLKCGEDFPAVDIVMIHLAVNAKEIYFHYPFRTDRLVAEFVEKKLKEFRETVIAASSAAVADHFGAAVTLSSDASVLVVGPPFAEDGSIEQGATHVYDQSGTVWVRRDECPS